MGDGVNRNFGALIAHDVLLPGGAALSLPLLLSDRDFMWKLEDVRVHRRDVFYLTANAWPGGLGLLVFGLPPVYLTPP